MVEAKKSRKNNDPDGVGSYVKNGPSVGTVLDTQRYREVPGGIKGLDCLFRDFILSKGLF